MTGDFSRWRYTPFDNFSGTLPQQGRVLSDADGLVQTRIAMHWEDTAARDTIGPDAAAVAAEDPDAFRVTRAQVSGGKVKLALDPGHVWADGLLAYLPGPAPVSRIASYLQPPIQSPAAVEGTIGAGVRDAVVLEVWREAHSAFRDPEKLLEPALGGPDTAAMMLTAFDFRLYRMGPNDNCSSIAAAVRDDFSKKGKLTVKLQPPKKVVSPCPVADTGGYTGFEHSLYRIEIAHTASGAAMFKYSRFNGGLAGSGTFDAATKTVTITQNLQAITTCGLDQFYLEAEAFNADRGCWEIIYGAKATLNNSQLTLSNVPVYGATPATTDPVFFRLWDDIRNIADFPVQPNPAELRDGILLAFDAAAANNYTPRDYWTFSLRGGGIKNPETLVDHQPPEGIHYHRVPLAEIEWNAAKDVTPPAIEDCRIVFQPLTRLSTCCTYRVGDGIASHGDFKSVQQAIDHLPAAGGEICVLPGTYTENVVIKGKSAIRLHGCGSRSRLVSPPAGKAGPLPVITVQDSTGIKIDGLGIEADPKGAGVLLEGTVAPAPPFGATLDPPSGISTLRHVTLCSLDIAAAQAPAIQVNNGQFVTIEACRINMQDVRGTWPAVFFIGSDSLIERNEIRVKTGRQIGTFADVPAPATAATGGLQLGGGCVRVRVINNLIEGGIGNGITLGSIVMVNPDGKTIPGLIGWVVDAEDPCNPCKPGSVIAVGIGPGPAKQPTPVSAGTLYDIRIERNRIRLMGLNGVGVIAFFSKASKEMISVDGLAILGNDIRKCLIRPLAEIPNDMLDAAGYGGIALADVTHLTAWDNVIEDNGPSYIEPVCGIFLLHGEGVDITRNRIVNNGARTKESTDRGKAGPRGGIWIGMAAAPLSWTPAGGIQFARVEGTPALKVHENIVSVQLGQALAANAMGPVSVVGNQFTSLGLMPASNIGTVRILELALSLELFGKVLAFQTIAAGAAAAGTPPATSANAIKLTTGAQGRPTERWLADGPVLFAANQCLLDLLDSVRVPNLVSVEILSLDDVGFTNNQCRANLLQGFLFADAVLFGFSNRTVANRFEEVFNTAVFSAVTYGFSNMTTQNVATHCIWSGPAGALLVDEPNNISIDGLAPGTCKRRQAALAALARG